MLRYFFFFYFFWILLQNFSKVFRKVPKKFYKALKKSEKFPSPVGMKSAFA